MKKKIILGTILGIVLTQLRHESPLAEVAFSVRT